MDSIESDQTKGTDGGQWKFTQEEYYDILLQAELAEDPSILKEYIRALLGEALKEEMNFVHAKVLKGNNTEE